MFVAVTTGEQREIVETLAREIWTEHYTPLIGREQVEYMLGRFQSREAVAGQIRDGVLYFLQQENGTAIGYLAVQPRGDALFLSKIYVRSSERRRGRGSEAVRFAEGLARARGLSRITLTVNRNNTGSITAYEKMGFQRTGTIVQDIGGGFVMDDFEMMKPVRRSG